MSTRKGKDGHTPLDPRDIEDDVARRVAERFVAGEFDLRNNRGRRYEFDGKRDRTASDGRRTRSDAHRGSGVHRRGRRTR